MELFFDPKSVVVVGASNAPFNLGATICTMLKDYLQYPHPVDAVNSRRTRCRASRALHRPGLPKRRIGRHLGAARHVPGLVRDCAENGIKHLVIESAGFSEGGDLGEAMQREIDAVARKHGIRILGPNCLGTLSTRNKFCCFYGVNPSLVEMKQIFESPGVMSYVLQSGGVAVLVMESLYYDWWASNKLVSIGNTCDVEKRHLIAIPDDEPEIIGMNLENISAAAS